MKVRQTTDTAIVLTVVLVLAWNTTKPLDALSSHLDVLRTPNTTLDNFAVDRVIAGDTIALNDGSKVRIAGIDTPERGDCGCDEATNHVQTLITNTSVVVTLTDKDTDR